MALTSFWPYIICTNLYTESGTRRRDTVCSFKLWHDFEVRCICAQEKKRTVRDDLDQFGAIWVNLGVQSEIQGPRPQKWCSRSSFRRVLEKDHFGIVKFRVCEGLSGSHSLSSETWGKKLTGTHSRAFWGVKCTCKSSIFALVFGWTRHASPQKAREWVKVRIWKRLTLGRFGGNR